MRLGDLDALFSEIENDYKNANGMRRRGLSEALDSIADAPTIDAVPIVRCWECKHRETTDCPMCHEEYYVDEDDGGDYYIVDRAVDSNGFCCAGEREDGEG